MLIELRVENHRSIRDEQALTMQAADDGDMTDPRPRQVPGFAGRLLPAAALYGANASGKSNILSALGFLRDAVISSHRSWPPEGGIPRDPFAWGGKSSDPSLLEVTVLVAGVRYQYGFVANDERFIEEWLYAWPASVKETWFERDGDLFEFGEHLTGKSRLVEQVTRPNALFLSAAVQLRDQQLVPLYLWFRNLRAEGVVRRRMTLSGGGIFRHPLEELLTLNPRSPQPIDAEPLDRRLARFLDLLHAADVGIVDVKVQEPDESADILKGRWSEGRSRILLLHRSDTEDAWLPLEQESQGTRTLCQKWPRLLDVLGNGGLALVDELEASIHPALALEIVRLFNDPHTNPHNAQILFTTHDTHLLGTLLGEPPLRRDQVWLTEKDPEGATCLYPLTDYQPRPAENLERGYLQGRYGAIPFLGDLVNVGSLADGE